MDESVITPWEVEGEIDYNKLIKQFGTDVLSEDLLNGIKKHTKDLHPFLKRRLFFSHRDLGWILKKYEEGEKFALYTGRGPSGHTHLGHLVPWIFCKWLQDKFDCEFYFQMTDDEKFMMRPDLTLEQTHAFAYENALDVIALGFDPKKTFIFSNIDYAKTLYKISIQVAKNVTTSTAKAVFGFKNSTNIGMVFFPSVQAAPCFLPSVLKGYNVPVLIPAAIDQDPYWRITRDVAEKLGYYKPAAIHNMFLPGLEGPSGKMSASKSDTAIFSVDDPKEVERKVKRAFTGGGQTVKEHKAKGGNPGVCTIYQYLYFIFEEDNKKIKDIHDGCKSGEVFCGECKNLLSQKLVKFITTHQENREKARDVLDKFLLKD